MTKMHPLISNNQKENYTINHCGQFLFQGSNFNLNQNDYPTSILFHQMITRDLFLMIYMFEIILYDTFFYYTDNSISIGIENFLHYIIKNMSEFFR